MASTGGSLPANLALVSVTQSFPTAPAATDTITIAVTCANAQGDTSVPGNTEPIVFGIVGYLNSAGETCNLDAIEWSPRDDE